jgi:cytidylate kinase
MPGSGKSTIAKELSTALGIKRYYIGGMRRDIAKRKGMTLEELNKLGETDPSTDKEVDNYQVELAKREDNFIMEGRTSFFLIPNSIKIFVDVDFDEGCRRIFKELQEPSGAAKRNETGAKTLEELKRSLAARMESDHKRYKKYYNMDNVYDRRHFDIVIDTTGCTIKQSYEKVLSAVKRAMRERASKGK